jgi:hypothetical protein
MERRLNDAVIQGYPSKHLPQTLPDKRPKTSAETFQMLEGLRPTTGNLAPEEAWRRMIGGRNRYNYERQQVAEARRDAIFSWLLDHRSTCWIESLGEHVPVFRIMVRHGDGAMFARALKVGKATICRDLSALQATAPASFGLFNGGVEYIEYMEGWRYAHRTWMGNEQPHHNLRYPNNQRGAEARIRNNVARYRGISVTDNSVGIPALDLASEPEEEGTPAEQEPEWSASTFDDFITILEKNCSEEKPNRRQRETHTAGRPA